VNLRQIHDKKLPNKIISGFFFALFRWYLGSTFSLSLEKNDTIRLIPPYLVIGNHANFWDGALVNLFIKDPVCFLVSDEYFRKPLLGWLLNIEGSIPKKKFLVDFIFHSHKAATPYAVLMVKSSPGKLFIFFQVQY